MAATPAEVDTEAQVPQEAALQTSAEDSQPDSVQNEKAAPETAVGDADERVYPKGIALICILVPVTLTYFLFFLDLAVVSTATPAITSQFHSLVDVGWYGFLPENLKPLSFLSY